MKEKLIDRINSDNGFMGPTHALSALALSLCIIAFFPKLITVLFPAGIVALVIGVILFIGASLLPDFDNVKSTVISVLGIVGQVISTAMRASARFIYSITRSKYDKPNADPHRGFWHTAVAGILAGFLGYILITLGDKLKVTIYGQALSFGRLLLILLIAIAVQLILAVFAKSFMRQISKNVLGKIICWIIGLVIAFILVMLLPTELDFHWVWASISGGWITHILGDTLTTSGTPLLFPIPHKGHRWWTHRWYPRVKANGPVEHYFFIPLFTLLIGVAIIVIAIR